MSFVELCLESYVILDKLNSDSSVKDMYIFFCYFSNPLVGKRDVMFFIGGEGVDVCNTDVILCDDYCSAVHLFDSFEDITMYFR